MANMSPVHEQPQCLAGRVKVLDHGNAHIGNSYTYNYHTSQADAAKQFLNCLRYPQMFLRRQQISMAVPRSYKWIFSTAQHPNPVHSSFITWLGATDVPGLFWIEGKPGSGKSTLMKYIENQLEKSSHTAPWAPSRGIVRVHHYFWAPGSGLQHSPEGFYRSLLYQVLEQRPDLVDEASWACRHLEMSETAVAGPHADLRQIVVDVVSTLTECSKLLLVVDGLDECDMAHDGQNELVEFLSSFSTEPHVKTLVSSRSWNLFIDSFAEMPKLLLQNLTKPDIKQYIDTRLGDYRLWKEKSRAKPDTANRIMKRLLRRAEGVFLWVVLVVRGIRNDLQAGDTLTSIAKKVEELPTELEDYFRSILMSIEPSRQQEASTIFQMLLFSESLPREVYCSQIMLADILFVVHRDLEAMDLSNIDISTSYLNDTIRRVNNSCQGLVEFIDDPNPEEVVSSSKPKEAYLYYQLRYTHLDFIHRSLWQYFQTRDNLNTLLKLTGNQTINAQQLLCHTRICQLLTFRMSDQSLIGFRAMTVNVMSLLAISDDQDSADIACSIAGAIENIPRSGMDDIALRHELLDWRMDELEVDIFANWHKYHSNFLTLAIDFGLSSYLKAYMTFEAIHEKSGRPILDYILRPAYELCTTKQLVNPEVVGLALQRGSNPNEVFLGCSVWCHYVSLVVIRPKWFLQERLTVRYVDALVSNIKIFLDGDADRYFPYAWLLQSVQRCSQLSDFHFENVNSWFEDFQIMAKFHASGELVVYVADMIERFCTDMDDSSRLEASEKQNCHSALMEIVEQLRSSSN